MKRYKLTNQNMQTYNGFQWKLNKEITTSGEGTLCSSGWLHCYDHPLLAVLLNHIHADIDNPRLFECECGGMMKNDCGLKRGYTKMKLTKEILVPEITIEQKVTFGILCAKVVCKDKSWNNWADKWLGGTDRSEAAARAARAAVWAAGTAEAASWAARAAARAARAAVWAAEAARAAGTAAEAAGTAEAAAWAAAEAAEAAEAAARVGVKLNLIKIAEKACDRR